MMHTLKILAAFIMIVPVAHAQRYDRDSLISVIKKSGHVEGERIGLAGVKSYTYQAATLLWEQCTADELAGLCSSEDPELCCYAFLGIIICRNDRGLAEKMADLHKKDIKKVSSRSFCIQWEFTVSDYMETKLREFYDTDKGYRRMSN